MPTTLSRSVHERIERFRVAGVEAGDDRLIGIGNGIGGGERERYSSSWLRAAPKKLGASYRVAWSPYRVTWSGPEPTKVARSP